MIRYQTIDYGQRAFGDERGTEIISSNHSVVRRAAIGDLVIVASFAQHAEQETTGVSPKLVSLDETNRQVRSRNFVPAHQA